MVESPTPLVGTSQFTHYMPRVYKETPPASINVNPLPSAVLSHLLKCVKSNGPSTVSLSTG